MAGAIAGVNALDQDAVATAPMEAPAHDTPVAPTTEIDLRIDGHSFPARAVISQIVDTSRAEVVAAELNGRAYLVAPDLTVAGQVCFVEISLTKAKEDFVVGCDAPSAVRAKGGWLIYHDAARGRTGLLILPDGRTASTARAGTRSLTAGGRAVVFRELDRSVETIDVMTVDGDLSATFPEPPPTSPPSPPPPPG